MNDLKIFIIVFGAILFFLVYATIKLRQVHRDLVDKFPSFAFKNTHGDNHA